MTGRAQTRKNVSEVLVCLYIYIYKMNESLVWGLPAIQALTGSPVARGVTSDPHPADHPSPWTLARAGALGRSRGRQGSAAPSHAHGHPGGVLRKDEGVARGGRLSSGLGWDPPPGGNEGQGGVDRGRGKDRVAVHRGATGPRAGGGMWTGW